MNPIEHAKRTFAELEKKSTEELLQEYASGGTYGPTHPVVEMLIHQRLLNEIANVTKTLNSISKKTYEEVADLAESSDRVERLTITLRNLTLVLIVLTVVVVLTPFAVEVWHGSHVPEVKVISLPPTPPQP